MLITYSGYDGGNEWLEVTGMTTRRLGLRVYTYESGTASVNYQWARGCGGVFFRDLKEGESALVGQLPEGLDNLKVWMRSANDMDIQLYDLSQRDPYPEGTAIIAYCAPKNDCNYGPLTSSNDKTRVYGDVEYTYSGYNGVGGQYGNEFITVNGVTNRLLEMRLYAFKGGTAQVFYSYGTGYDFEIPELEVHEPGYDKHHSDYDY